MSLKELIASDADSVFFNTGEFAEEAAIDGRRVPVIFDDDSLGGKSDVYAMGLSEGGRLVFIRRKDLEREPQVGDQMTVDGKEWYVRHAVSNFGVWEIRIGKDRH